MDENDRPRNRSGAPRRPTAHRARPGSGARPLQPNGDSTRPLPRSGWASDQQRAWQSARTGGRGEQYGEYGRDGQYSSDGQYRRDGYERQYSPHEDRHDASYGEPPAPPPARRTSRGRGSGRGRSRIPRPVRLGATLLVLVLVITTGWFTGLAVWADSRIDHVDALSEADNTPGTTYLIAGSDQRDGETVDDDGTQGQRADTIMLLHRAPNGSAYLISLPRDTLVDIPGHGTFKLNAAYALGGPSLLVATAEDFTGLTIDHYVEIGFAGVQSMVDAVGHVNLCIDQDVADERSGLVMSEGCHDVGGEQALAFVRARYFDPAGDLGRQQRQQQFVAALMDRVTSPQVLLNPAAHVRLAGAGSAALTTSEGTGLLDVGGMALTMRRAFGDGASLPIPIEDPAYQTQHSGLAILTDDDDIQAFFESVAEGSAEPPAAEGAE